MANVLSVAFGLALLAACFPLDERTVAPTPTPMPTATPAARLALPDGYTAYPNAAVVVVDIDLNGTQGAAAQEAIIEQAKAQGIDVLVMGCMVVDNTVSVCPTTPFFVRGGASVGTKRARR